ncbi:Hypothetical predicted protein [Octopus vulgaris]|uniref:Uncharacterized protein n=1 Tax=Octopus vulgaris TaxID=6645 RepID=A0AA36BR60_OCTVU|nr:Hypothetical predicted protein [Octopus vulgaris]
MVIGTRAGVPLAGAIPLDGFYNVVLGNSVPGFGGMDRVLMVSLVVMQKIHVDIVVAGVNVGFNTNVSDSRGLCGANCVTVSGCRCRG